MTRALQDIEAERRVLCAAIREPSRVNAFASVLSADAFHDKRHAVLWRSMVDADDVGDIGAIVERLHRAGALDAAGGADYIGDVRFLTGTTIDADRHVAHVVDLHGLRTLRGVLSTLYEAAQTPDLSAGRYGEQVLAAVLDAVSGNRATQASVLADLAVEFVKDLERAQEGEEVSLGVPWPWRSVDDAMLALEPSLFYIIAGRPAMGKSVAGMQVACHAARTGTPAVVYSLEMADRQLCRRVMSSESGVYLSALRLKQVDHARFGDCVQALDRISEWAPLTIDDTAAITIEQVRARSKRLAAEGKCGLVVVDYLQLMRTEKRCGSREQEISEISRGLKALAKEMEIPVVGLAQLNRELEKRADKRPILSDLRESGSIEQDSDAVVMMYRPAVYATDGSAESKDDTFEWLIRKQRDGRTGMVPLRFDGGHVRITE
jgi:replicative DNA helicase